MTKWQPIDTAPKDGTPIIAYRPAANVGTHSRVIVVRWYDEDGQAFPVGAWCWPVDIEDEYDDEEWMEIVTEGNNFEATDFTHWMPLPEPPE